MNEIVDQVIKTLSPVIVDLLVAVLTVAFTALITRMRKVQGLKHLTAAVELLQDATVDTVASNQSLIVDGLKAATGKLTAGEIEALQSRTIERVRAKIGPAVIAVIEGAGADLDTLILDTAEAALRDLKRVDSESKAISEDLGDFGAALAADRSERLDTISEYMSRVGHAQAAGLASEE